MYGIGAHRPCPPAAALSRTRPPPQISAAVNRQPARQAVATYVPTTQIPTAGARTLPGRYYKSPELFAEEHEKIFARRWLCVGREEQLAKPGDYFVQPVGVESIVVLRDRAGRLRAYYNVCRHRGTKMCWEARGRLGNSIQCPYHAWTYALDGRLLAAPSADELEGFRKEDYSLHPVGVARWEGFLFINLSPDDAEPFEEAFAPVIGRFSRFNMPSLHVGRRIDYDVRANWKLIVQNYSECYHCAPVHPALTKITPPTSGENDLVEGPCLGGFMVINEGSESLTMSGRACGVPVGDLPAEDHRRVYYYALFPNMLLSLHPDYVMCHTLWPQDPGRTLITCEWLFNPETLERAGRGEFDIDDGVKFWDMTNRQDWEVCERSQDGVVSRMYRPGPYSRRESMSVAFDREVLKALGHAGREEGTEQEG
jgi:glycine betaine catabolism A